VRSGQGEARTILLVHIISARPSKQPLMVRTFLKVYMELGSSFFVSARTNKRHHHLEQSRVPSTYACNEDISFHIRNVLFLFHCYCYTCDLCYFVRVEPNG